MRGVRNSHELLPEEISTVEGLKTHLCDLAYHRNHIRPESCQGCRSCRYGIRLLEIMGIPIPAEPHSDVDTWLRKTGAARPTLRMRLKGKGQKNAPC